MKKESTEIVHFTRDEVKRILAKHSHLHNFHSVGMTTRLHEHEQFISLTVEEKDIDYNPDSVLRGADG